MKILVVDDNLLIRRLLRAILTEGGHEVVGEAEHGADALRLHDELRPDLVTLDLVMPGEGGLAVLFELMRLDPPARVVVCSAHLTERRVLNAIDLGASGFIGKPFDRATVLDAVGSASPRAASANHPAKLEPAVDVSDRRDFERVAVAVPIVLMPDDAAPFRTVTIDISGNGFAVANSPLRVGERARFSLRLLPGERPVMGWARAVRAGPAQRQALTIEDVSVVDHERMTRELGVRLQRLLGSERAQVLATRPLP